MKSAIQQGLFKAAHACGYTVVPNWRLDTYPQTVYLKKLFELLDIDCVLDVGANRGQYHDFLREHVGFKGTIISFEPLPDHVGSMRARAASDPKWIIEACALGAATATTQFNVMASTTFSSFLQPKDCGIQQFRTSNEVMQRIDVPVKRLDDVLPELLKSSGSKNVYLKLDTQGYDLEVVRGATASLQCIRGLQTEATERPIYEGMPEFSTVLRALEDQDFEPSGIYPNNAGHFPLLVEFDFHMINKRFRSAIGAIV